MSTRLKLAALAALCAAQLGASAWSIARYESTLESGALYRIRTIPVDPADAFRGRYVAVRPSVSVLKPIAADMERRLQEIQGGGKGYVVLATGNDGFAQAAQVLTERPSEGDYLEAAFVWPQWSQDARPPSTPEVVGYSIDFSFDRYYMNEAAAPAAQQRYADATRLNAKTGAWLAIRVKNGVGVIEGLFIDGVPIETIVSAPPK